MVLSRNFRKSNDIRAVFSFEDVSNGIGTVPFFGIGTETTSGEVLSLVPNVILDSEALSHKRSSGQNTSFTKMIDLTFTSSGFNLTRTLKGQMLAFIPYDVRKDFGATNWQIYVIIKLFKNSTSLIEIQSGTISETTINGQGYFVVPLTVPQTIVKKDDVIKVVVEGWLKRSGDANPIGFMIAYNSSNNVIQQQDAGGNISEKLTITNSKMEFRIPFRINL